MVILQAAIALTGNGSCRNCRPRLTTGPIRNNSAVSSFPKTTEITAGAALLLAQSSVLMRQAIPWWLGVADRRNEEYSWMVRVDREFEVPTTVANRRPNTAGLAMIRPAATHRTRREDAPLTKAAARYRKLK